MLGSVVSESANDLASSAQQLVVLVGGKGTRLGALSQNAPKPMMQIDEDTVFLDYLLEGALRQGFRHVVMIAGHLGSKIEERYAHRRIDGADIDVVIEPSPMGTAGALAFAKDVLAHRFVLMNGDTIFDANIRAVDSALTTNADALCSMALRNVDDVGRYGAVEIDRRDGRVTRFVEKSAALTGQKGMINAGVYSLRREVLDLIPNKPTSLESDILPALAEEGRLMGVPSEGYFLDIGLPETLQQARNELPQRKRPVLFLDRDGVVNVDGGYTHRIDQWQWMPGAVDVIRRANNAGVAVVVVTNQAGVARGYYEEPDIWRLHHDVQRLLHREGAFIDHFYYCPDHPDAVLDTYRTPAPLGRKPSPAMLARALKQRRLDPHKALLVGDQDTDLQAAAALGIPALCFTGGHLDQFLFQSSEWTDLISS